MYKIIANCNDITIVMFVPTRPIIVKLCIPVVRDIDYFLDALCPTLYLESIVLRKIKNNSITKPTLTQPNPRAKGGHDNKLKTEPIIATRKLPSLLSSGGIAQYVTNDDWWQRYSAQSVTRRAMQQESISQSSNRNWTIKMSYGILIHSFYICGLIGWWKVTIYQCN